MSLWPALYRDILQSPYESGERNLRVLTGYASSSFVHHLLYKYESLRIDLTIGMAKQHPITIWDHNEYVRLTQDTERLRVQYYHGNPPIHVKAIHWSDQIAFAGSANFTWNGYRDYREMMVPAESFHVLQAFPGQEHILECTDPHVFEFLQMGFQRESSINDIDTSAVGASVRDCMSIELSLTQKKDNQVHDRSGLNWGQRDKREPNQAYIPVSRDIHNNYPGFFPAAKEEFTIITDDGESFVCVIAQQNDKAIETKHDNSILGKYFRRRLGLRLGSYVTAEDLFRYGRTSVTLYKIDNETYYMDFSKRSR